VISTPNGLKVLCFGLFRTDSGMRGVVLTEGYGCIEIDGGMGVGVVDPCG